MYELPGDKFRKNLERNRQRNNAGIPMPRRGAKPGSGSGGSNQPPPCLANIRLERLLRKVPIGAPSNLLMFALTKLPSNVTVL
jgi:hypothetical protein